MKKYRFNGFVFLGYANSGESYDFPEFLNVECIEENCTPTTPENIDLPIVHIPEISNSSRRDKILEQEGISSWYDLSNAYFLVKSGELHKPKKVRDYVGQKYTEVMEFINF